MRISSIFLSCLVSSLLGVAPFAHAEDIDIYSASPGDAAVPNVLLVLDNAANFSSNAEACTYVDGTAPSLNGTAGGIEQCAIYNVVKGLPDGAINLGLMVYNGSNIKDINNANCGASDGGCLVQPLALMSGDAKTKFLDFVKSWRTSGGGGNGYIKASGEATGAVMQEAWAYYAGKTGLSGRTYVQPAPGCQKNFIIFVGNAFTASGTPGESGNVSPKNALVTAGATAAQQAAITIPSGTYGTSAFSCKPSYSMGNHTDSSGLYADEWARFMYQTDIYDTLDDKQGIATYTIGLLGNACKPDYPALLTSMAKHGGGAYFATSSYQEISTAIMKILNEIQAVNSVFSSASLPVSVNAQGTYLNQVFLGMFRPDEKANPRWVGNLKQYQFILEYPDPNNPDPNKATLKLGDSTGAPAISSAGTGFITPTAISFWTSKETAQAPDSTGGFFIKDPQGAGGAFDSPDGEVVEKGGAAQQLRLNNLTVNYADTPSSPRRLYTYCPSGSSCEKNLTHISNAFATTNSAITDAKLNSTASDRANLINWVRGEDNAGDEKSPGSPYTVRPSIHGDVLHSRPVVINYGDSRGLVVYYGANDGVFRAVNGKQTKDDQSDAIGTVRGGGELWGLVLPEFFGKLKRQRANSPVLKFSTTSEAIADATPKDYFVDGSAGVFQKLKADGTIDKAYLYLSMRRGGRFIYALDVSTPTEPKVMWKISEKDAGFAELGQTWSRPRVTLVSGYADPVLVFGAGYDPAEDAEPPTAGTMGRGIFVVDALTGARVWSATSASVSGMNWAIAADIGFVDRDNDGKTDRFYAADVGGNVWRVDLEPDAGKTPDKWKVTKLAALGCPTGSCASGTTPRKFFFPPNVVSVGVTGKIGAYDAVMLGSGDREHPLESTAEGSSYNVVNRFYMLKDTMTGKDAGSPTVITEAATSLFDATSAAYDGSLRGFYMTFETGEKSVNASTTVRGTTFFGTNRPTPPKPNSCASNLGVAKGYALNPFTGKYDFTVFDGGGLPPTPTTGIVTIETDNGPVQKFFCVGCGGGEGSDSKSTLGAGDTGVQVPKNPRRTYWYKQ